MPSFFTHPNPSPSHVKAGREASRACDGKRGKAIVLASLFLFGCGSKTEERAFSLPHVKEIDNLKADDALLSHGMTAKVPLHPEEFRRVTVAFEGKKGVHFDFAYGAPKDTVETKLIGESDTSTVSSSFFVPIAFVSSGNELTFGVKNQSKHDVDIYVVVVGEKTPPQADPQKEEIVTLPDGRKFPRNEVFTFTDGAVCPYADLVFGDYPDWPKLDGTDRSVHLKNGTGKKYALSDWFACDEIGPVGTAVKKGVMTTEQSFRIGDKWHFIDIEDIERIDQPSPLKTEPSKDTQEDDSWLVPTEAEPNGKWAQVSNISQGFLVYKQEDLDALKSAPPIEAKPYGYPWTEQDGVKPWWISPAQQRPWFQSPDMRGFKWLPETDSEKDSIFSSWLQNRQVLFHPQTGVMTDICD